MKVLWRAMSHTYVGPKTPIELGWNLATAKVTAYDSHHLYTHQTISSPILLSMKASVFFSLIYSGFIQAA